MNNIIQNIIGFFYWFIINPEAIIVSIFVVGLVIFIGWFLVKNKGN